MMSYENILQASTPWGYSQRKIPNNQTLTLYYNVCGAYWNCYNFAYKFENHIREKQKPKRNINQSAVIKDRNYGVG